jgi:hypothetical protein
MPKKPTPASRPDTAPVFVVAFEYARRSFQCVLIDWAAPDGRSARQWVITVAGRPIWSFEAGPSDTRESVRAEVERWWDSRSC